MNTDEILLQILEEQKKMRSDMNDMRSEMTDMRSDITELQKNQREMLDRQEKFDIRQQKFDIRQESLENGQKNLENNQKSLEKDVKSIKITLENEVSPAIKMLSEMQLQNSKRLIVIEKDVQDIKDDLVIDEVLDGLEKIRSAQ